MVIIVILSTQTSNFRQVLGSMFDAVKLIKDSGFDAFDASLFGSAYDEPFFDGDRIGYVKKIRKYADDIGIVCTQAHAPFPVRKEPTEANQAYNDRTLDDVIKAMEDAAILGAKGIVVHPVHYFKYRGNEQYVKDYNMDMYRSLAPYGKKYGITILVENMFKRDKLQRCIRDDTCSSPREFVDWLDTLGDGFGACLDLGHTLLVSQDTSEMIYALGSRLMGLHVTDNDGIDDRHTPPFTGINDWEKICKALADIKYDGDFTFESDNFYYHAPVDFLPTMSKYLCSLGRYLINKIDSYR